MEQKRETKVIFLGLELGENLKSEIQRYQGNLQLQAQKGKWKDADNFHITIKYIGETEIERIAEIDSLMEHIEASPFMIHISGLECFRRKEKLGVLYLGISGDGAELGKLYEEIEETMVDAGFRGEKRGYTPHITLGNDILFDGELEEIKEKYRLPVFSSLYVDRVTLFESKKEDGKRIYVPIKQYRFGHENREKG